MIAFFRQIRQKLVTENRTERKEIVRRTILARASWSVSISTINRYN